MSEKAAANIHTLLDPLATGKDNFEKVFYTEMKICRYTNSFYEPTASEKKLAACLRLTLDRVRLYCCDFPALRYIRRRNKN